MSPLRAIAVALAHFWPTEVGLWRVIHRLPDCDNASGLAVAKLRGFPLCLEFRPRTYMGKYLYYRGMYEEAQVHLLEKLLRPGMTFVDVGANVGLYSVVAAHLVGPRGRVIAVEPQFDLADIVAENARLNRLDNVVVKAVALGAVRGNGVLHQVSKTNDGQATLKVRPDEKTFGHAANVPVQTLAALLDECGADRVDGVKIDVEGGELDVMKGLEDYLRKGPAQFVLLECIEEHLNRFGATTAELISFLHGHQYRLFCLWRGRWRHIESANDHARYGYSPDFAAVGRSVSL